MTIRNQDRIIAEFDLRRKRMMYYFASSMILIALSLAISQIVDSTNAFLGIPQRIWSALGIAQFVAAVVFAIVGFRQYRCPSCGEIVRGHDKYYFGLAINPDKCPHCGTRLS